MDFSVIMTIIATLFGLGTYFAAKHRDAKLEAELMKFRSQRLRESIEKEIDKLDQNRLDKKEAYEKQKENLYNLIKRNNNSSSGPKPDEGSSTKE